MVLAVEPPSKRSSERSAVSVFVVEDHPLYAYALEAVIARHPELDLVGIACDGVTAIDRLGTLEPAVVLLDLTLPRKDGLEVLHTIRHERWTTKALIISAVCEGHVVRRAMRAGALGFLSKDADAEEITTAILSVVRGGAVICPRAGRNLTEALQADAARDRLGLTRRERDVLELLAAGASRSDIASRLHLSEATVKTHLAHLYEKLDVSERAAAVASAFRYGAL
jgi:two-component system nitrate/nitrite response regulator NarL